MIGNNLLKYNLNESHFVFADFETENLNLLKNRPWEAAWIVYNGKNKVESHQYYLKWPDLNVCKGAADATGFKQENIDKLGKDPKEVVDLFDKYVYDPKYKIIGANFLHFDIYVHNIARKELGYNSDYSYLNRVYDTVALSRAYKLGIKIPEDKNDMAAFQYRCLNIRQKGLKASNSAMAKEFGVVVDETKLHGALYDCELTAHVFFNLIQKIDI